MNDKPIYKIKDNFNMFPNNIKKDIIPEKDIKKMPNPYDKTDIHIDEDAINKIKSKNKVTEKVITDTISGIKSDYIINNKNSSLSTILNKRELLGKTISTMGKDLLSSIVKKDIDDKRLAVISKYFDAIVDPNDILNISIDQINSVLGNEIVNNISKVNPDNDMQKICSQLLYNIYSSYNYKIQYNDDISTLNSITDEISLTMKNLNNDNADISTIKKSKKIIDNAMSQLNDLNKKYNSADNENKGKIYSIDDNDIKIMKSLQIVLDKAINFTSLKEAIMISQNKYKKDFKHKDEIVLKINTWLNELASDTETIYVLPVSINNITTKQACVELVSYLSLAQIKEKYKEVMVPYGTSDLIKFYMDKKYMSDDDLIKFKDASLAFLYIMSRTFKVSKIKNNEDKRRELSYILDYVSKANLKNNRKSICDIINYAYNKLT